AIGDLAAGFPVFCFSCPLRPIGVNRASKAIARIRWFFIRPILPDELEFSLHVQETPSGTFSFRSAWARCPLNRRPRNRAEQSRWAALPEASRFASRRLQVAHHPHGRDTPRRAIEWRRQAGREEPES